MTPYDAHPVTAHPSIVRLVAAIRGEPIPTGPDAVVREVRAAGVDQPAPLKRRRVCP
jgi:hypothetical protein